MPLRILTLVSTILLASGVGLLLFYAGTQLNAKRSYHQGIEAYKLAREARASLNDAPAADTLAPASPAAGDSVDMRADSTSSEAQSSASAAAGPSRASGLDTPDQSLWSPTRIADYEKYGEAVDEVPEGIMRIPSVDLELPVFSGTREANLTRGAGRIEGTAPLGEVGNTGIAAHRDGYFRSLKDVAIGDEIVVETLDGTENYRIDELLIVNPEDVYVLDPTDNKTLTLVTCYPFYFVGSAPQRFIVRASGP